MRTMRFLKLYLLSQSERSGLAFSFDRDRTLIMAENQWGKSAVVKSLYEAFGATPHKIDNRWRKAGVISLLEIAIDGSIYKVLKTPGYVSVFDSDDRRLIDTDNSQKIANFWAEKLGFGFLFNGDDNKPTVPPSAYIFAPYYIDQDRSWTVTWSPFVELAKGKAREALAEYYIGVKTADYYKAWAEREARKSDLRKLQRKREGFHQAIVAVKTVMSDVAIDLDMRHFEDETVTLLREANSLYVKQIQYRAKLAGLDEELRLWLRQRDIVTKALAEIRGSLNALVRLPGVVSCPTCGTHFENSIGAQFDLVKDEDSLLYALSESRTRIAELEREMRLHRLRLNELDEVFQRIQSTLSAAKKEGIELREVVRAQGRLETQQSLSTRISDMDVEIRDMQANIADLKREMELEVTPQRVDRVLHYFFSKLNEFAGELDVMLPERYESNVMLPDLGRGSETPRTLFAYYFSVIASAYHFRSSPFCPVVIDAPNQQGQDTSHLRAVMRFAFNFLPEGTQVIVGAESEYGLDVKDVSVYKVGQAKRRVLDPEKYNEVMDVMRPYLGYLL
ncbi:hypothetical protein [Azospirillum sp.]|uniref:hypothetical protein n=1 Tax=Azospirillum sp. TaxID=34012 RepID=UPI002D3A2DB5|nr:hypothetical protein [Azospirillum sp.]HYD71449.1 hypothetical protein [Azospirillum sp.]